MQSAGLQELLRQPLSEAVQPVADDQEERADDDEAEAGDVVPPPVTVGHGAILPDRVEVPEGLLGTLTAERAESVASLDQTGARFRAAHHPVEAGDSLDEKEEKHHQADTDNCGLRARGGKCLLGFHKTHFGFLPQVPCIYFITYN